MKVLIWFACCILPSIPITLINNFIILGAIPVFILYSILYGIAFALARKLCKEWDVRIIKKEAFAKGMSIRQYIESTVPASLIDVCEMRKGDAKALKDQLKISVESGAITKRISVVLLEMYK